jgi:hypothetical protein
MPSAALDRAGVGTGGDAPIRSPRMSSRPTCRWVPVPAPRPISIQALELRDALRAEVQPCQLTGSDRRARRTPTPLREKCDDALRAYEALARSSKWRRRLVGRSARGEGRKRGVPLRGGYGEGGSVPAAMPEEVVPATMVSTVIEGAARQAVDSATEFSALRRGRASRPTGGAASSQWRRRPGSRRSSSVARSSDTRSSAPTCQWPPAP